MREIRRKKRKRKSKEDKNKNKVRHKSIMNKKRTKR